MDLLIDIGNSRIKWAGCENGELVAMGSSEHGDWPGALAAAFTATPERVMAASVAGEEIAAQVEAHVNERWQLSVEFARSESAAGPVTNGYHDPAQLGVDRWLAVLAAWQRCAGACCVVDAGTAVTVDLIDADAAHLGGVIIPGRALMQAALHARTGEIESAAARRTMPPEEFSFPGRDTAGAIDAGVMQATACLIDNCVERLQATQGGATLLLTGGDAAGLLPLISTPATEAPYLVLEGLALRSV